MGHMHIKLPTVGDSKPDWMQYVRTLDTTYLHNGMILSTLGLSPHGFSFGLTPKGLIPMEIFVHPYIPMILPTSSQCGTIGRIPNNPPLEQRTIEPPLKRLSIRPLSTNQDSPLQCVGSTRLTWNTTCLESLLYPRSTPLHRVGSRTRPWRIRSTPPV